MLTKVGTLVCLSLAHGQHKAISHDEDTVVTSSIERSITTVEHYIDGLKAPEANHDPMVSIGRSTIGRLHPNRPSSRLVTQMNRILDATKQLMISKILSENEVPESIKRIEASGSGGASAQNLETRGASGGVAFFDMSAIWEYGCWCSFGDSVFEGRGQPVNAVDAACKNMTLCSKCVKHDTSEEMGKECNPKSVLYNPPRALPGEQLDVYRQCERTNRHDICKLWTCTCETEFAASLVDWFFSGQVLDASFRHDYGFDPKFHCNRNGLDMFHEGIMNREEKEAAENHEHGATFKEFLASESGGRNKVHGVAELVDAQLSDSSSVEEIEVDDAGQKSCCGFYPYRRMYSVGGHQACCESAAELFSPRIHSCCADGSVRDIGTC